MRFAKCIYKKSKYCSFWQQNKLVLPLNTLIHRLFAFADTSRKGEVQGF